MLLLEREARKEAIERKGKNYRFWLFRRKLYHIVVVYTLIIGLITVSYTHLTLPTKLEV